MYDRMILEQEKLCSLESTYFLLFYSHSFIYYIISLLLNFRTE